jgi:uncharacterized protein DUF1761
MQRVSLVATLVGTILAFGLGALWYGPLFAKAWMAEHTFPEDLKKSFNPGKIYGTTFVLAFISAYVCGMFIGPNAELGRAIGYGLLIGICFAAFSLATNYMFEGRSMRLFLINGGYHVVRFGLVGLAFGLLG